ncbi:uncharacterized protein [Acropora muricata]|uniref:uncharacterized protein isoform X5 n=1 Tax=Acropora muricata TaxID=159855 RepID=UPI0034E5434C
MSNMSMEASSLSFNSEDWANLEETKPFSAVYAVKKKVQTGICQHGGMACLVLIKVGKSQVMNLVTSSDVIADLKADKKPTEMHPFLMKTNCHLVVKSPVSKFGPFSFLSFDPQSSPGLQMNPQPTCLDFQVPKQDLESEFEAYTFVGSKKLKLKFVYQSGTGKYILSAKEKKQLELSFVLGAPIIIENEDVRIKHLSSRWSVVGVMGLNEERELSPYFVAADLFDSRSIQREDERSVTDNELNTTAADSSSVQRDEEQPVPGNELNTTAADSSSVQRDEEQPVPGNELNTTAADSSSVQRDEEQPVPGNELNTTAAVMKAGAPSAELLQLSGQLAPIWKIFARVLGISEDDIGIIEKDSRQGVVDMCYSCLLHWERNSELCNYQFTFTGLAAALCHDVVGRRDLVEKYCYEKIK